MLDTPAPFSQDRGHCLQRNVFLTMKKMTQVSLVLGILFQKHQYECQYFLGPITARVSVFFFFFFFFFLLLFFFPSYVRSNVLTTSQIHGKLSIA